MKPVAFEYFDPATPAEAAQLLERLGDDAKLLAGGQSLIPMLNFRVVRPKYMVDLNRLKELDFVRVQDGHLHLGALTRERTLEHSELVRARLPLLAEATTHIGHAAIRNRGTVGGSLAHADPSAEYPVIMKLLGGSFRLQSAQGSRWVHADDFFLDYLTVALEPRELIAEVKIPLPPDGASFSFQELARRSGDFAIVSVAVQLDLDASGRCREARISLGGVGPTPLRALEAEKLLAGQRIDDRLIQAAAEKAEGAAEPTADMHASVEYRRELTRTFTRKCLAEALRRGQKKGGR